MVLSTKFHAIRALKYLPAQLLRRLLAPYADALRLLGLELAEVNPERLLAMRESLPEPLVAFACDLNTLSGQQAWWGLRAAAARNGRTLPKEELPIVAAAHLLLDRPELRMELLAGSSPDNMPRFRELVGRRAQPRNIDIAEANGQLKAIFIEKGIAPNCQLQICEEEHLREFSVRYAPWKIKDHEMCGERVSTCDKRPVITDIIVYDTRTGRLRLGVNAPEMRSLYTDFFGRLLFGQPDWFHRGKAVCLEPLDSLSQDFFLPTRGLRAVRFCGVELAYEGRKANQLYVTGEDVMPLLERLRQVPGVNRLLAARFAFLAHPQRPWQYIELRTPDIVSSCGPDAELARRFLEERGLLAR